MWVPVGKLRGVEADGLQKFMQARIRSSGIAARKLGNHHHVARDGEVGKEPGLLDHIADAPAESDHVSLCDIFAVHTHRTCRGASEAIHHAQQRGFAGAAAAQQRGYAALRQAQINVAQQRSAVLDPQRNAHEFDC
jgi:hypothetical protein